MKVAAKKYLRNLLLAMASYMFILFGVNSYLLANEVPQVQQIILALLPMLPVLVVIKAILTFARTWDELQRKKSMEAMLIAFILVATGTFAYGFLEGIGFPPLETIWVLPIMFATHGLSQAFVASRY